MTVSKENMLEKCKITKNAKLQTVETLCPAACGLVASMATKQCDYIPASSSVYNTNHSNLVHNVNNNSYNRETRGSFSFFQTQDLKICFRK